MVEFLIKRPIATIVIFFALLVLGFVTMQSIPISLLPDIEIPEITVYAFNDNFTAREMQDQVAQRLNEQFMQCKNIDDIYTETTDGKATIKIKFDFGTDIHYAALEINEHIDKAVGWLPREMERPKVVKANVSDIPVFYISISNTDNASSKKREDDFIDLSRLAERIIKKRFEYIPEVAFVDISGLEDAQITIKPDRQKLKSLGLGLSDIELAFQQNNVQYGNIALNQGIYHYNVRIEAKLNTKRDIENILIKTRNQMEAEAFSNSDRLIRLKDIAEISLHKKKSTGLYLTNNRQAISLAIIKQPEAKVSDLKYNIEKTINILKKENKNIDFTISQDQTVLLNESINNLKYNLLFGALLAILIVFIFYNNAKEPLLIGLSIPLSLIISLFFFWLCGLTINIVSLSGLVLAIGMMVDNAIIVIDNITQNWSRENNLYKGVLIGTNQIIVPLLSSILTTIAIFVPLIFISGIAGGLFTDNALAVSLGLGVSFWVSIILLPVIHHLLFKKKGQQICTYIPKAKQETAIYKILLQFYNKGFDFVFNNKKAVVAILLCILIAGSISFIKNDKRSFPVLPETEFFLTVDWNEGISPLAAKDRLVKLLYDFDSRIVQNNSWVGLQDYSLNTDYDLSPTQAKVYFEINDPLSINEIQDNLVVEFNKHFPLANITIEESANIFNQVFKNSDNIVELRIYNDKHSIDTDSLKHVFSNFNDLSYNGEQSLNIPTIEYFSVELLNERILLYDLTINHIINILLSAFDNYKIGSLNTTAFTTSVFIGTQKEKIEDFINSYTVEGSNERSVPLNELVKIRTKESLRIINSNDKGEYAKFPLNEKLGIANVLNQVSNRMLSMFPGIRFNVGGSYRKTQSLLNTLLIVLIISIVLLYFILSAQFESLLLPFIVLIEIPIDIGFALLILYLFGYSINIMVVVGLIVSAGIVINDSILKIDTINKLRKNADIGLKHAIHEGGVRRLKSIVMTSLTTLFALVPTVFSSSFGAALQKPFAVSIIACLGFGTLVSLLGLPLFYWLLTSKKNATVH